MKNIFENVPPSPFLARLKVLKWAFKQLVAPAPRESFLLLFITFIQGVLPGISLIVIERIVNWLSSASPNPEAFPYGLVALWSAVLLLQYCLYPILALVRLSLNEKVLTNCNVKIMEKANSFRGIGCFESAAFLDTVRLLQKEAKSKPLNFAYSVMGFFTGIISLISMSAALTTLSALIPLLLLVVAIPHAIATLKIEEAAWDQELFKSPTARKMNWLSASMLDERTAKEMKLFGFGFYFIKAYKNLAVGVLEAVQNVRIKQCRTIVFLSLVTVLGNIALFIWLITNYGESGRNIGALVMALQGFVAIQSELAALMQEIAMLYPVVSFFGKLKTFLSKKNTHDLPESKFSRSITSIEQGIRFENVCFSYADGRVVLKDINLIINAKEKLAIVGENGAGKTTLIKLLMRFYDPTSGRITVDGVDLREVDLQSWRNIVSAVFQDYGQYHLTIRENIGLGNPHEMDNAEKISKAVDRANFQRMLARFPDGFHTLLGKEFGGTSLSGGEWQKLAMARAFMKDAALLILDEPTAALDPKSEYEVFQKFAEQAHSKTTLFITHRLGSVLLADRIVVLKEGQISEHGTHAELMRNQKDYATFFRMQAAQYEHGILAS